MPKANIYIRNKSSLHIIVFVEFFQKKFYFTGILAKCCDYGHIRSLFGLLQALLVEISILIRELVE